jgi:hypothetical protein
MLFVVTLVERRLAGAAGACVSATGVVVTPVNWCAPMSTVAGRCTLKKSDTTAVCGVPRPRTGEAGVSL